MSGVFVMVVHWEAVVLSYKDDRNNSNTFLSLGLSCCRTRRCICICRFHIEIGDRWIRS